MYRFARYLLRSLPLFIAVVVYGYTINLPLFLDDGPQFNLVESLHGVSHWDGTRSYHYYRPFVFSLWKFTGAFSDLYDPMSLHFINIVVFGFTGVVLGLLVERLVSKPYRHLAGVLAGIAYVIFPFSYQAVILVGALYHILVALCTVLVMWSLLHWLDSGRRSYLMVGYVAAFIGLFSHENGILILPITALMVILKFDFRMLFQRRVLTMLVPVALLTAIYGFLWQTVPRGQVYGEVQSLSGMVWSSGMLLQGLVYPFDAVLRHLTDAEGSTVLIIATVVITVVVFFFFLWRHGWDAVRIGAFGLLWYLVGTVPSMVMLDQAYVNGSPRLMLFSSLGGSILLGLTLAVLLKKGIMTRTLAMGLIVLAVVVSSNFLAREEYWSEVLNDYMRELDTLVVNQPTVAENGGIRLVNAPDYIIPHQPDYMFLRGSEGVAFMYYLLTYDRQIWVNTGVLPPEVHTASYNQILRFDSYAMYAHDPLMDLPQLVEFVRQGEYLYVTHFNGDDITPVYVGSPNAEGSNTPQVTFGDDEIELLTNDMVYSPERKTVIIRLRWQVNTPQEAKPFAHVFCDGGIVGSADADPWGETYPFSFWRAGEVQTEYREIPMKRDFDPNACFVVAGIYHLMDGSRLVATNADTGERLADDLLIIPCYRGETDAPFPFADETKLTECR